MRKFLISNNNSNKETSVESMKRKSKSSDDTESKPNDGDQVAKKSKANTAGDSEPARINKIDTDWATINFSCDKTSKNGEKANFKIASWNVAGIRACIKKKGLDYIRKEDADIVCLQEVKCQEDKLPPETHIKGYYRYLELGKKAGYSGVSLYTKQKPLKVEHGIGNPEFDAEGRLIIAEYEKFYLVSTYVPNSGNGLKNLPRRLEWNAELQKLVKRLDETKPVILAGDLNVCHQEIDIHNPKTNTKSAGFSKEEREGMTALLEEGFVDSFRALYPDRTGAYTWWSYLNNARSRNVGWRLDYYVVSARLMDNVCDNVIRSEVYGSDHCPIVLHLAI